MTNIIDTPANIPKFCDKTTDQPPPSWMKVLSSGSCKENESKNWGQLKHTSITDYKNKKVEWGEGDLNPPLSPLVNSVLLRSITKFQSLITPGSPGLLVNTPSVEFSLALSQGTPHPSPHFPSKKLLKASYKKIKLLYSSWLFRDWNPVLRKTKKINNKDWTCTTVTFSVTQNLPLEQIRLYVIPREFTRITWLTMSTKDM